MRMDFDHADLGEFTPEEIAGWFDALPDPEPEPTLEHVADRLPVQPQVAPPMSTSAWVDRPGSGLSALHAARFGMAPAPRPGQAAPKPVKTKHAGPAETLAERNIRELAVPIWTEARDAGDKAMTAVGLIVMPVSFG